MLEVNLIYKQDTEFINHFHVNKTRDLYLFINNVMQRNDNQFEKITRCKQNTLIQLVHINKNNNI